jgi:hypothetical protein
MDLDIIVFDDILADTVNTLVEMQPSIVVSDDITTFDEGGITQDRNFEVVDVAEITEFFQVASKELLINVAEADITIAEVISAPTFAFVVSVAEPVFVEDAVALIFTKTIFVNDTIAINEIFGQGFDTIELNIIQIITIIEAPIVGRDPEDLPIFDDILVLETAFCQVNTNLEFTDFLRSYPFIEETLTNVIAEQFENGAEQRRDKWGRTRKRFQVRFAPRLKVEIDQIRVFYESHQGPAKGFGFISPLDGKDYVVKFEANTLQISRDAFNIYSAQVVLVEVFP